MASTTHPVTQELLARAHSPDSANRIFTEKIQHRPILIRPSSPQPHANAREARRIARRQKEKQRTRALKPKPLSARQRKRLALYELPRDQQRYALFEPLHRLWLGYVRELLGRDMFGAATSPGADASAAAKLSSADLHGAEVEVVRSGCVSRVGIRGIVVKDAKFVFEIVTRRDQLNVVPKEGTIFRVEVPPEHAEGEKDQVENLVVEILGDQFLTRSADRANKKFKRHFLKDI
ncbi:uncharacterized protein E0L32_001682 [Thyridium curvatum]|uniref:Ribonuclease P protein subunit n=1 Tax=Thyridium curvatum TaxID=1093900 RepID=A0A507AQT8_9PEZI|nr:uncharacterized protein E0L32_001516 [Thyridium curvatum]XP_030990933.1 uncharacterized protein E0L32_001682 [Thyridium curvatum]TPX09056.1 hypothetical protein E0L32_001516 [Thyridium curvatum]TPX09222.1 hypothetical protein E0L32_001682 [Thyridium curvatum]